MPASPAPSRRLLEPRERRPETARARAARRGRRRARRSLRLLRLGGARRALGRRVGLVRALLRLLLVVREQVAQLAARERDRERGAEARRHEVEERGLRGVEPESEGRGGGGLSFIPEVERSAARRRTGT